MAQATASVTEEKIRSLEAMAARLRRHSLVSTLEAGSGHPTSCMSCAELITALFFHFLRYDLEQPKNPANDRFILSKGHAAPILWAVLAEAGAFPVEELVNLRKFDSDLEGHPTPRIPFVDAATGSLGQGLSVGVGMARSSRIDRIENHIYVLLGDGETAEGAVWEAAAIASQYGLDNLTAIIDVNRLGQSAPTMYGHDVDVYARRLEAFGWNTQIIDGHCMEDVIHAYAAVQAHRGSPSAIIARTHKGKGVRAFENKEGRHGKPASKEELAEALEEIGLPELLVELELAPPDFTVERSTPSSPASMSPPDYSEDGQVATRKAYGNALEKLGGLIPAVVALDGDVKNSTHSLQFAEAHPSRFTECYIAEQNMVGMAMGMSAMGKIPFVSTFGCFLTRACDQIRVAGISRSNIKFCGSHVGVSVGEDGPTQMALEDLALFRSIPGSVVLYPADGVATERCVELAANHDGIVYLRTTRPGTPILYTAEDSFRIGGSSVLKISPHDVATIVGAGITTHEALKAADALQEEGTAVRVIDLYSIKPIDHATLRQAASETGVIITAEDHYPQGGLGEAVLSALAGESFHYRKLAIDGLPRSGDSARLMSAFGIDAASIASSVRDLLAEKNAG